MSPKTERERLRAGEKIKYVCQEAVNGYAVIDGVVGMGYVQW